MGYYSRLAGKIEINPPLKWGEFKDSRLRLDNNGDSSIVFVESVQTIDTDDGVTTLRHAVAVVPRWEDPAKHYDLKDDLKEVARLASGRTFSGALTRSGDDQGDVERYQISGQNVTSEAARLVWPDGETVDPDEL